MTTDEHITRVKYNEKELILIATAHVSKASAELVKEVINREQPDSICVELDEDRYNNMKNPKAWSETDLVQVIKDGKVGFMLANLVLSSYQKKLAKQLDTNVGQEMVQKALTMSLISQVLFFQSLMVIQEAVRHFLLSM